MEQDRETAIFYPAAICNLNCRYCSIDKNPILIEIDKLLEESFKGDYYINFLSELFPYKENLKRIETWGGEPSLGWYRMHNLIRQIINSYPNFTEFFSSTNMVAPKFLQDLQELLNVFGEFPNKRFKFILQISLDGPTEINDGNRGIGVTKKIEIVFEKMVNLLETIVPKNIDFECYFKPTLDEDCINHLQTKEDIINYYKFFEKFYDIFNNNNTSTNSKIFPTVPNTATPGRHTKEAGRNFANMCRLCKEIEKEGILKYYKTITPYNGNPEQKVNEITCTGYTCGTCKCVIGLLPNNMVSGCHAAFVDLLDDYKKKIKAENYNNKSLDYGIFEKDSMNFFCFPKEKLALREQQVENFYKPDTTARLVSTKTLIQAMAYAGQIDPQFQDSEQALLASNLIYRNASNCMKDNIGANSTISIPSVSLIRLLLNGAYKYIRM